MGMQTRAMVEAHHVEGEANQELTNNPGQAQSTPDPAMNPTVDLHRTQKESIKEFVRQQGTIALDWYVPNFCKNSSRRFCERLPIKTKQGTILFKYLPLSEYFHTSIFELDLIMGQVYTYHTLQRT